MLLDNSFKADARVEKEAFALVNEGYEVKVLCIEDDQQPPLEIRNGIKIIRCLKEGYNAPLRKGYEEYLEEMAILIIEQAPDILHCHDFYMLSIGARVKKKLPTIHLIYDAHEFLKGWPFYKTSSGMNRLKGKIVYRRLVKQERSEIKLADKVITITEGIAKRFKSWAHLDKDPLILGNYPEQVEIVKDPNYFRSQFPISDTQKIIIHSGTIYHSDEELKTLFNNIANDGEYSLIFVGNRPRFDEVKSMVNKDHNWKRFIFFHDYPSDQSETIRLIANADIGLLFVKDKWIAHQIGFSNRFVEYIMAGIPVVGTPQEFSQALNQTYHTSLFYKTKDQNGLEIALGNMKINYSELCQNAENARKALSWKREVQKLINYYDTI